MSLSTDILILGAGMQGAGIALELARRGNAVTLLDQDEIPFNRASLRNEGKIHLGLIYANDRSLETAALQLEGALRFRPILDRWLGSDTEWQTLSTPFHYLVAADSVLAPDDLAVHYERIQERCRRELDAHPDLDYLGERPRCLYRRLATEELAALVEVDDVAPLIADLERRGLITRDEKKRYSVLGRLGDHVPAFAHGAGDRRGERWLPDRG